MTEGIHACHGRRQGRWPVALALALLLTACGGGDGGTPATDAGAVPTPAAAREQKGFGPTELYDPTINPTGRVLQEGDTGIVFVPQAGAADAAELRVWFEIARASSYAFEMEDEDLSVLTRVDVGDAAGQVLLSVDADHRLASASLAPGRYALRLVASPTNPETMPLFIRFGDDAQPKQPAAIGDRAPRSYSRLEPHSLLAKDCIGCDLRGAFLRNLILSKANLRLANLSGAILTRANLREANLSQANLSRADLEDALLPNADLESANLSKAYLRGAHLDQVNLSGADLTGANLIGANLSAANLSRANLGGAILEGARLSQANLGGANLSGANLSRASLSEALWVDGRTCSWFSLGQCE